MGIQDLIITPIYLIIFYALAYFIRPHVTDSSTKKYFIPALSLKFFGAIAVGLIYQFYYSGGDTFNYFIHGSKWIWTAFLEEPIVGIRMLFEQGGERIPDTFEYSQHIWYYKDQKSFLIVRILSFIDIFTLHTYSASALFFAVFSFSGSWMMYKSLSQVYPNNRSSLAFAVLFVPSVVFWGSGILKDTVTLGSLTWLTFCCVNILMLGRSWLSNAIVAVFFAYFIILIKPYVVICFVPTLFIWVFMKSQQNISIPAFKFLLVPLLVAGMGAAAYGSLRQLSTFSTQYSLDTFAQRAAITAYDISYGWGARSGGGGAYDLGGLPDGSVQSMVRLMPAAISVTFFRPFIWEVKNPLMLLAALESLIVTILAIRLLVNNRIKHIFNDPFLLFCLTFSVVFAFAVGISTYNFGTLMRYKIPVMPFLGILLALVEPQNSEKANA